MSSQTLVPFAYIPENSQATPGLWNSVFSTLSQNIALVNSNATLTPPSGNTLTVGSDLSVLGTIAVSGPVRVGLNSNVTNYLFLSDTSNARSNYVIGSQVGGTADGLNIWDDSGQTMIVSFSKQSIRFFQQVVGPVFDVGGALASTLNAATFGGSLVTTQIQAAISAASNAVPKIKRVYVPASMYPFDPRQISFDTNVQMVREGGAWDVYDIQAYGAKPDLSVANAWSTTAIQAAIHGANGAGGGIVYVPPGTYGVSSVTLSRRVTLRGAGGGRDLTGTAVSQFYQNDSTITTIVFLADQGGSGAVIEDLQIDAAAATNGGGIRIAGMEFCLIRGVSTSGTSGFAIQIEGGNETNMNAIEGCAITMASRGTALDIEGGPGGLDATPYVTGCFFNVDAPAAWISIKSTSSGIAPDSALFTNNRFIASVSAVTAIYALATNCRFIGNRFENTNGSLTVTLAPPTGSQAAGEFIANSWAVTGGSLIWNDSANTPSTRFQEITSNGVINAVPGSAVAPAFSMASENSLGWYRSAASTMALSYGTLALPSGLTTGGAVLAGAGTALSPTHGFASEASLGLFRSGASSLALSYGSLRLPLGGEFLIVGAGTVGPLRLWENAGTGFIGLNETKAFAQDSATNGSWLMQFNANAGGGSKWQLAYTAPGGSAAVIYSVDSLGNLQVVSGTAKAPGYGFLSENSLGVYRSASSTLALSYGTLDLTAGGAVTSIASLKIKSGANNSCGTAVLGSNGSVNVANTYVAAGDLIFLTDQTPGGTLGDLELGGIRAGSGFTIQSTSITDTSTVGWLIIRPT